MGDILDIHITKTKSNKTECFYKKAIAELISFYNINWIENTPKVYLANSRAEFNMLCGYETDQWMVGKALDYNKLLLFSPESYEKESCHKYSDEEYYHLLKHELSHLFYSIFSEGKGPVWLDEGFAIYVSGELAKKKRPKVLKNFLQYYSHMDKGVYAESGFVVECLINRYGKSEVLSFLKNLPKVQSEKDFREIFEKYFNIGLDYKSLETLL